MLEPLGQSASERMTMKLYAPFAFLTLAVLVAPSAAQSSLSTYVQGAGSGVYVCSQTGQAYAKCTGSQSIPDGGVTVVYNDSGSAEAGFGTMTGQSYSEIVVNGEGNTNEPFYNDFASQATSEDELSILGLNDGEVAYLSGFFSTNFKQASVVTTTYEVYLGTSNYTECIVDNNTPPFCRITLPITYSNGSPVNFSLITQLLISADSRLAAGAPAGADVITSVQAIAYANFKVVNSKGQVISGVTVVGSSGHIYN
jgi:hypothetical protein